MGFVQIIEGILAAGSLALPSGRVLGVSREGREIAGHVFGRGPLHVSLIGGCHADEPVGPAMLRRLAAFWDHGRWTIPC